MLRVRFSSPAVAAATELISFSFIKISSNPRASARRLVLVPTVGFSFRSLLDAKQLMLPEALETSRPLVQRPDAVCIRSVKHVSSFPSRLHQTYFEQNPQMFGDGGLRQPQ